MSLADRTNEEIPLSLHGPLIDGRGYYLHGVPQGEFGDYEACLHVDVDFDSDYTPAERVTISLTDNNHDSDTIEMTYEEAGLLADRLNLILGRDA